MTVEIDLHFLSFPPGSILTVVLLYSFAVTFLPIGPDFCFNGFAALAIKILKNHDCFAVLNNWFPVGYLAGIRLLLQKVRRSFW